MGVAAVFLIYSSWGKRSGAFMNPAMIVSFLRLGRVKPIDAFGCVACQFIGGTLGVILPALVLGSWVMHPSVNYVVTVPGSSGLAAARMGEFIISLGMIFMMISVNKVPRLAPWTGYFAGLLLVLYITYEAPYSGMSLNPARTFRSAIVANLWTGWWIYLTAPVLGMLGGVELHRLLTHEHQRLCGKLNHSGKVACFIRCNSLHQS